MRGQCQLQSFSLFGLFLKLCNSVFWEIALDLFSLLVTLFNLLIVRLAVNPCELSTKLADATFVKSVLNGVAADKGITGLETKINYLGDVLASANTAINAVTGATATSSNAITLLQNAIKVQSATQGSISDTLETYSKGGATPTKLDVPAGGTVTPLAQAIADEGYRVTT